MVRSLTTAQKSTAEELEKVRQEKLKLEQEATRLKKQLKNAEAKTTSTQSGVFLPVAWPREHDHEPVAAYGVRAGVSYSSPSSCQTSIDNFEDEVFNSRASYRTRPSLDQGFQASRHLEFSGSDEWSTQPYSVCTTAFPSMVTGNIVDDVEANDQPDDEFDCETVMDVIVPQSKGESCGSRFWKSFAWLCTFFIPSCCIMRRGGEAKQAWREKVAICVVMMLASACFVGVFGFIPLFVCQEEKIYRWEDIWAQTDEAWTVIDGTVYDMKDYINKHPGGTNGISEFLGKDASKLFARIPPADLPPFCLNPEKDLAPHSSVVCTDFTAVDELVGLPCHDFATGPNGAWDFLKDYEHGVLAFSYDDLKNDPNLDFIIIHNRVYNVTNYVNAIKNDESNLIEEDHEYAYLEEQLNSIVINKLNEDATEVYDMLFGKVDPRYCLDDLFYVGVIDDRSDPVCHALNIIMFSVLIFVAFILVLQCLCSLLYLARSNRTFTKKDGEAPVMVMVPCYNEGELELRKTIDSVVATSYPGQNKVLLVVADGLITGKGERASTPQHLARILGFHPTKYDRSYAYSSIGRAAENSAYVYHGVYKKDGRALKYVVVVKSGNARERGSPRAGNRGKRDSQIMIAGMLNRVHHRRSLSELDSKIVSVLNQLKMPAEKLLYLMTIDADTRVSSDSISHMVYSMNKDEKILALCGETRVDNKTQSWVTMIQVFEYYTNHHMKKGFESVFGCVTCLPGCFTMYRMMSEDGRPLLSSDDVYRDYSKNDVESLHEKNLYHLGEDRMLTTLLLRYFPDMRLSFVPEAVCFTIVPHTFSILLSQRRRWINSTFHNMLELLKVKTMCGICCFSMKTVVFLDLIASMVLPASMLYAAYFVYLVIVERESVSTLMLILYGVIIGVQLMIFILRSQWDYLWWFFIFALLGAPVFYFILPLYAFWHMDDFSWGSTRQVTRTSPQQNNGNQPKESKQENTVPKSSKTKTAGLEQASRPQASTGCSATSLRYAVENKPTGDVEIRAQLQDHSQSKARQKSSHQASSRRVLCEI